MTDTKPRQRGGQPRAGEPATRLLRVRVTADEWLELEIRRREHGCKSVSEYVRMTALGDSCGAQNATQSKKSRSKDK